MTDLTADLDEIDEIMDTAVNRDGVSLEDALEFFEQVEVAASARATAIREDIKAQEADEG